MYGRWAAEYLSDSSEHRYPLLVLDGESYCGMTVFAEGLVEAVENIDRDPPCRVKHISPLLRALDLRGNTETDFDTLRTECAYISRLLQKCDESRDDELFCRNMWPCNNKDCSAVLGPMDGYDGDERFDGFDVTTFNCPWLRRSCPQCGEFRMKHFEPPHSVR